MLMLERKIDEIITITSPTGDVIKIHLIETHQSKSKLGVDAPQEYLVLRDELIEEHVL